jgi:hypothetical protein
VGVRVLLYGGLLVLMLVGGELHIPLQVRGRPHVLVGARLLLLLLQEQADIGLVPVVLMVRKTHPTVTKDGKKIQVLLNHY